MTLLPEERVDHQLRGGIRKGLDGGGRERLPFLQRREKFDEGAREEAFLLTGGKNYCGLIVEI